MSDFSYEPDQVFDETLDFKTAITRFESGVEQRRAVWATPLRRWKLQYRSRSLTVFQAVRDFYIARQGSFDSFTWTNPNDDVEYTVRFEKDSITFTEIGYNVFAFELTLAEVRL